VEDPDFAKQNNRDAAAGPLAYFPTKLLEQGFNVPPQQIAACRTGEDQLKGSLVLPLHPAMVLPLSTRNSGLSRVCRIRITLIITRPQQPWRKTKTHASGPVHDDVSQAADAETVIERIAL
jgi:hypothetical protein